MDFPEGMSAWEQFEALTKAMVQDVKIRRIDRPQEYLLSKMRKIREIA